MMRSVKLIAALALTGCSYFQSKSATEPASAPGTKAEVSRAPGSGLRLATSGGLLKAMHDRYDGKSLKTMSLMQNHTDYKPSGAARESQWNENIDVSGQLRISFLP